MQRVTAKINLDGTEEIFEGGLKSNDENGLVLVLSSGSEISFPKEDVINFQTSNDIFILDSGDAPTNDEKPQTATKKTGLKAPSLKLKKVIDLCVANPNATRKQILSKIVELKIMNTEAGASTYHQNAKPYVKEILSKQ